MKPRHHVSILPLFLCFTSFTPIGAQALSTDREQPINIEADSVEIDDGKHTTIYKGHVVMTQGSIHMTAESVRMFYDAEQNLEKVLIRGSPATFRQTPGNKKQDVHAKADKMEYFADKNRLHLIKRATIWQGGDRFSGDHIEYDTFLHVVKARKSKSGKDRVRITIQPRK